MRSTKSRILALALLAVAVGLAMATTSLAAGAPHVTNRNIVATDASGLSFGVTSNGDAGEDHNLRPGTSPVDPSGLFSWFNQPVSVTGPAYFVFPNTTNGPVTLGGATFAINTGSGYGTPAEWPFPYTAQQEGVYSIVATGTDVVSDVAGTVAPAFGIDRTDPTTASDATQFYSGTEATITITATDTMSGVESLKYTLESADGPLHTVHGFAWDAVPSDFAVPVHVGDPLFNFAVGKNTLSWDVVDNAGNPAHGSTSFIIDNAAPTTTSNLAGPYTGAATITLTAIDNPLLTASSGVAHTYYILDGVGTGTEGTTINVPAPAVGSATHTLSYWSVDKAGNVEAANGPFSFVVNAVPVPVPHVASLTVSGPYLVKAKRTFQLRGTVAPAGSHMQITRYFINSAGTRINYGRYNLTAGSNGIWIANVSATRTGPWRFVVNGAGLSVTKGCLAK